MAFRRKVALALAGALLFAADRTAAQRGLEYEVKAGFLYNIINFVTWPPDAFAAATDPVHVCIVRPDPFGRLLDRAIEGGTANSRPIVADRIADANDIGACHLVFLPGANTDRIDRTIRAAGQRPVLTVGEAPDFLRRGGMIAFVVDGGRVRFDINLPAATGRGLMLSSRLLQVARTVVGKGQTG